MKRLLSTLLLTLSATLLASAALIPDMKFRRLDTRDGLSNSQINCLLRDSRGYVWVGTPYGLNRYDGYRFRTFYYNDKDTFSLRSNYIDRIFEAFDGRLWLKQGMSYTVYDPTTERFLRNSSAEIGKYGIKGGIEMLHIDSRKNFWVKTYDDGLYIYNPYSKELKHINYGYGPHAFEKEFGVSWACDFRNSVIFVSTNGELICVNGKTGYVSWKSNIVKRNHNIYSDYRVYIDPQTNIYVITQRKGTFVYAHKERKWFRSLPQLMRARGMADVPDEIMVWDVKCDHKGQMWVATDHLGVLVIDWRNGLWRQFTNDKSDETSLSDITVKQLMLDQLGRMWIGSYKNGVNMTSEHMTNIKTVPMGDINAICEDTAGNYWLGLNNGGIKRYDSRTGEVEAYTQENAGLSSDVIVGSYAAKDGTLWFGTFEGGIIKYNNGQFTCITTTTPGSELRTNNVWALTEDKWGNIWAGVLGGGITRIDKRSGRMKSWTASNSKLINDWTCSIEQAPSGMIVFGNSDFYSLINPSNFKITNDTMPSLPSGYSIARTSNHVIIDSRGLVWQGSTSGVGILDRKTGQVALLDMNSGLMGSSVCSVAEDKQGYVWVVTDHGVSRIAASKNPEEGWSFTVRSYGPNDGLQNGPFNQRAICVTHDGLVLLGGGDGLDIINPRRLTGGRQNVEPRFSGLVLYDEEVAVGHKYGGRVILKEALDVCRELRLNYSENNFTIHLASDNGEAHSSARFVYKLEGLNEKWVKTSSNNPNISYMSLHHGNYTLCVRMLNDDGSLGAVESRLNIIIRPPLWRTRWAMLCYIVGVLVVAWWWRRRFLRKQEERMELERIRREAEKKQWMSELESAKAAAEHREDDTLTGDEPVMLNLEPSDLVFTVKQACALFKLPPSKRMKINFMSPLDKLDIKLDRRHIARAIDILLGNAAKFSPGGTVVTVSVNQSETDNAVVRIADHGIGVPEGVRLSMFDATANSTGLRMNLVKRIVEGHGGTINAEDNPGGGTIIVITLPIGEVHPEIPIEDAVLLED